MNPEKWVENYADVMYGYAFKILKNEEESNDMVQDTFLSALKNKSGFLGNSSEKTWLFRILQNKILDLLRKRTTTRIQKDVDVYDMYFEKTEDYRNGHGNSLYDPKNWVKNAQDTLEKQELYLILHYCIAKLPEKQAQVMQKKFLNDEKSENICQELNISTSNFWALTHRAKISLRACVEKNWEN